MERSMAGTMLLNPPTASANRTAGASAGSAAPAGPTLRSGKGPRGVAKPVLRQTASYDRAAISSASPGAAPAQPRMPADQAHDILDHPGVDEPRPPEEAPPAGEAVGADEPVAPGSSVTLFEQAVEQNSRRLLAIARAIVGYRASPEDVVQQAIMNLYKHRARYDWRKPGGLLKRATVNEALRLLRPPRMSMVADDHAASFRAPSSDMETSETVRRVREAIDQLPEHFRAALVLCEYEQMSYAQIAETLDASIPQIKTWLHRARRKLATMLEDYVAEAQTR